MTRIIGGSARGRRLKVPAAGTRPTTDRVRESLFNMLDHRYDGFDGVSVADVYAGSGAFGLEAASRGASPVVLVDNDRVAVAVMEENIRTTGLKAHVAAMDAKTWVSSASAGGMPFDIVFLDPPYNVSAATVIALIADMASRGLLADECDVLYECARPRKGDETVPMPAGFDELPARSYGDTQVRHAVWYVHRV